MSFIELNEAEAAAFMQQMQGIGKRLSAEAIEQVTGPLADVAAGVMQPKRLFRRKAPITLELTPAQAEILLRSIEDNGVLRDPALREEAREELRSTPWAEAARHPGHSLMKKLAHCASASPD